MRLVPTGFLRTIDCIRAVSHPDRLCSTMTQGVVENIATGELVDYVVAHGRSQYSGAGGPSACGLAAMNCARVILLKERAGLRGDALLEEMMKESTADVSVHSRRSHCGGPSHWPLPAGGIGRL